MRSVRQNSLYLLAFRKIDFKIPAKFFVGKQEEINSGYT